jgi:hypothetical protein
MKSSTGRENNYCHHYVILRSTGSFAITKLNCSIVITTNSTKSGLLLYIIDATLESSGPPAASQFIIARIAIFYTPATTHINTWTRTTQLLGIRGAVDYPRHTTTLLDAFNAIPRRRIIMVCTCKKLLLSWNILLTEITTIVAITSLPASQIRYYIIIRQKLVASSYYYRQWRAIFLIPYILHTKVTVVITYLITNNDNS